MHVRVVRFTGVTPDRIASLKERITSDEGPPPGVKVTAMELLYDEAQGSAIVLQHFASLADLEEGAAILSAMPAGETPGDRASVDTCEVTIAVTPS